MSKLRKLYDMFAKADSKAEVDALAKKLKAQKTTDNAQVIDAAKARREELRAKADSENKAPSLGVAGERAKNRAKEEGARFAEKKASVASRMTVSATDIKEANTALKLEAMQKRLDSMDDGLIKKSMQKMLNKQVKVFEAGQSADVDKIGRASAQSNRDRKMKDKITLPKMPFNKGGLIDMRKTGMFR